MRHQLRKKLQERLSVLFVCAILLSAVIGATPHAEALYIITGTDDSAIVLEEDREAPDLSSRMVYVVSDKGGFQVAAANTRRVTIHYDGQEIHVRPSQGETFSQLLYRMGITLSPLEMVAVDLSGPETQITVGEDLTYYDKVDEPAPFRTVRVANPEMLEGTEKVVQEGEDGVRTSIYEVSWSNGKLSSRQFVEELDSTAVDKIVEYGTAVPQPVSSDSDAYSGSDGNGAAVSSGSGGGIASVSRNSDGSGTLTLRDGSTLSFSSAKTMIATAYTAGHGGAGFTTATGTFVQVGTVAVDKRVIPLGTRMYIVTSDGIVYGTAVAEDTGVRGNHVDLYFDTYRECIEFGRRSCTVYFLK